MKPEIRPRNRILHIFQLFEHQHVWSVDEIAREMGTSTSSAYRDVQEMSQAGFLIPIVGSGYVLGPAFVQFDRVVRISDPLIRLGAKHMRQLLDRTTQRGVAVLSRRYRDQVMCVHQETGAGPSPVTSYERGVAMPLFVGATSKAILAHLSDRALEKIYLDNEDEIRRTLRCTTWKAFRDHMMKIRQTGVAVTNSEVARGRVGIAAPIFASKQVIGGLSLVLDEPDFEDERQRGAVIATAQAITNALAKEEPWIARS